MGRLVRGRALSESALAPAVVATDQLPSHPRRALMTRFDRRQFLKGAASIAGVAGLAGCGLISTPFGEVRTGSILPADRKLRVACIGIGGMGWADVQGVGGEDIVALCDVDDRRCKGAWDRFPDAKRYKDYRVMLEEMDDQIDAVTVSTPDHTHYPATIEAIHRGKHVRVQKPMAHTIWQARHMTELARKHRVVTGMGIQGHSNEGMRLFVEWLRAGVIGNVREVHYCTNRPTWPQGMGRPTDEMAIPDGLDWNLWLGRAPWRPYHDAYLPGKWRAWWDFGCGALGDIGCHAFDGLFWALNLDSPTQVYAESSPVNNETAPKWSIVTYEFPERDGRPPVKVVWYDGGKLPPRPKELEADRELKYDVAYQVVYGDDATILSDHICESPRVIPESKMRDLIRNKKLPEKTLPRSPGSYQEFIQACKGGPAPGATFDYSGPLTEMVLLGNLALRTGQEIEWDAARMKVTNVREANEYIKPFMREF